MAILDFNQIIATLPQCAAQATESGDLLFFPSDSYGHVENGIEFRIRLCSALLHKPTLPTPDFTPAASAKKDPFAPPYGKLVVGEVTGAAGGESKYVVFLNKFAVVPDHFLLVTKAYQSQSMPPDPEDLLTAYLLLLAARNSGTQLFAFYNCGDRSGASQHHKHLQFVSPDRDGQYGGSPPMEVLAQRKPLSDESRPFALEAVPYAHYVRRLPPSSLSDPPERLYETLATAFISLLDLAIETIRRQPEQPSGPPSFNVLLTLGHIHIVPRSQESYQLTATGDQLSINALGFAGMLLVKSETELQAVRSEGVIEVLRGVSFPKVDQAELEPHLA